MTDDTQIDDDLDEPQTDLFPSGALDGDDVTPQNLVKKGLPTKLVVSLSKAEVPIRGKGLVNPNKYGRAIVTYLPAKTHELPIREDEHDGAKVTGWKVTQDLRAMYVEDANDVPALIRAEFEAFMALDANAAVALATELKETATGLRAVA